MRQGIYDGSGSDCSSTSDHNHYCCSSILLLVLHDYILPASRSPELAPIHHRALSKTLSSLQQDSPHTTTSANGPPLVRSSTFWAKRQQTIPDIRHAHPVVPTVTRCDIDAVGTTSIGHAATWSTNIWTSVPYPTLSRSESVQKVLVIVVIQVVVEKVDLHLEKRRRCQQGV